jgi:hypothetical protein
VVEQPAPRAVVDLIEHKVADETPAAPRLAIDLEQRAVRLDGVVYAGLDEDVLRWLRVLAAHPRCGSAARSCTGTTPG